VWLSDRVISFLQNPAVYVQNLLFSPFDKGGDGSACRKGGSGIRGNRYAHARLVVQRRSLVN
jgi:hypothetical protein